MSFCDNLRKARQRVGLTQQQVALSLGVTKSTYCCYENGKRQPDLLKLRRLALLLSTSSDELLGLVGKGSNAEVSPTEFEQIKLFRTLDAHGQRMVRMVLREEATHLRESAHPPTKNSVDDAFVPFRVAVQAVTAERGVYLGPNAYQILQIRRETLPAGASFGIPVRGSSLEPLYHDGNVLIVSETQPKQGDVGVFIHNGLGIIRIQGFDTLIAPSPSYPPIPMDDSLYACGTVVGFLPSLEMNP